MEIKYRPKLRNKPTEKCLVPILANITIPGIKHGPSISTGIKIPLEHWSYSAENMKKKADKQKRADFNIICSYLQSIKSYLGNEEKTSEEIKLWVQQTIKAAKSGLPIPEVVTKKEEDSLIYWFRKYKDYKFTVGHGKRSKKPLSPKTKKAYEWAEKKLIEFQTTNGTIKLKDFKDEQWIKKYRDWVSEKYPTSFVTRNKVSKKICETFSFIRDEGFGSLIPIRADESIFFHKGDLRVSIEAVEDIAPTREELRLLINVKLKNFSMERARDIYLLNIEMGQRIETVLRINPNTSKEIDGAIAYTGVPSKTGEKEVTPVIVEERNIKAFYKYFPWDKPVKEEKQVDSQATILRNNLKAVAKLAGLDREIITRKMNGKKPSTIDTFKLYEVLDFKSCRKFAITEYNAIYSKQEMKQTVGHEKGSPVQEKNYILPKAASDNAKSMIKKRRDHGSLFPD